MVKNGLYTYREDGHDVVTMRLRLKTLYIVHSDRKPFGIVLTKIATDTGNFTVH
jgi:hypothetical protein